MGMVKPRRPVLTQKCSRSLGAEPAGIILAPHARRNCPLCLFWCGYATLMALASRHGLGVTVSALTNPDFAPTRPFAQGAVQSLRAMSLRAAESLA
jgi:hypothetical protein